MDTTSQTSSFNLATYVDVLRYYAELVLRRWKLIVMAGLIAGILMFLWRSLSPATFTSRADVVMLIVRTTYEPAENNNNTTPQISARDSVVPDYLDDSRWTGLVAIANNPTILRELKDDVYTEFESQLVEKDIERKNFGLTTDVAQRGDVLRLNVTYSNAQIATWAANRWADKFVEYANRAYLATGETPETIGRYVDDAFEEYTSAAAALVEYQLSSQLSKIEREYDNLDTLMTEYENRQNDIFLLLNANKLGYLESADRQEAGALLGQVNELSRQRVNDSTSGIFALYTELGTLNAINLELSLIQTQVENGVEIDALSTGNYLALMLARTTTRLGLINSATSGQSSLNVDEQGETIRFAESGRSSTSGLSLSLELTELPDERLTSDTLTTLQDAVQAEITSIEAQVEVETLAWLESDGGNFANESATLIQNQVNNLANPNPLILPNDIIVADSQLAKNMNTLDEQMKTLEVQRNQLRLQQTLLFAEREAARNQYRLLLDKLNEVSAFDALGNTQVRRAPFLAVPPEKPNPRGRVRSAAITSIAVSSLAILTVVAWDGWFKVNVNQSATTKSNKGTSQARPS